MGRGGGRGSLESLPEECIAQILSFTSPRDVCRASAVSSALRSAAGTNLVWDRFLPPDWEDILGRCSSEPVPFTSGKELYFRLCDSILIDDGTKRAWLERATGKKCFMLAARSLSIARVEYDHAWRWISVSDARFPEAAELLSVCWLEIEGSIRCRDLSPETRYGAYLVMRLSGSPYGLVEPPQMAVIFVGGVHSSRRRVRLQEREIQVDAGVQDDEALDGAGSSMSESLGEESDESDGNDECGCAMCREPVLGPEARGDGWEELAMGDFFVEAGGGGVELVEVVLEGWHSEDWKSGLIVQGIELRPLP